MEHTQVLSEPLRISNSGKYELSDYTKSKSIAISGALLFDPHFESNLTTTIKIIEKEGNIEFDRLMLLAFIDPSEPAKDKLIIKGKFFDPKKYYLKIEPKNTGDEIHFLLFFSTP